VSERGAPETALRSAVQGGTLGLALLMPFSGAILLASPLLPVGDFMSCAAYGSGDYAPDLKVQRRSVPDPHWLEIVRLS
jgi:hypothetical protein